MRSKQTRSKTPLTDKLWESGIVLHDSVARIERRMRRAEAQVRAAKKLCMRYGHWYGRDVLTTMAAAGRKAATR